MLRTVKVPTFEASHWTMELHLHQNELDLLYIINHKTSSSFGNNQSLLNQVQDILLKQDNKLRIKLPGLHAERSFILKGDLWVWIRHLQIKQCKRCNTCLQYIYNRFKQALGIPTLNHLRTQQDVPRNPKGILHLQLRPRPAGQGWSSPGGWADCGQWTSGHKDTR